MLTARSMNKRKERRTTSVYNIIEDKETDWREIEVTRRQTTFLSPLD
jgi:hypothetical protein